MQNNPKQKSVLNHLNIPFKDKWNEILKVYVMSNI